MNLKATGVYVSYMDYPLVEFDPESDEINAHRDMEQNKVLQYIGATDDHRFVLDQSIDSNALIYKLLEKNEDGTSKACLYVPDVTEEPGLKFYRIPKLGCFFAVNLELKDYLNPEIYDQSC